MPDPPRKKNDAVCPRCGYDLRGTVVAWRDACPLNGMCAECGLVFEWAEVIGARAGRPGWCVEYARRWWGVPWRSVKTFFVALWPWGFWTSLKMTHEFRWRRIAAYLVLLVVPLYLFVCVSHGLVAWSIWKEYASFGNARLPSPFLVAAQSALVPYSNTSPGTMSTPGGPWMVGAFPPPAQQPRAAWDSLEHWGVLTPFVVVVMLCPAGFLALPVSRRQAKVRYAHIHRVTFYSMAFLVFPISSLFTDSVLRIAGEYSRLAWALWGAVSGVTLGFPIILVIWWSCATGRYLKIRHAWGVGLAVALMASLVTLLAICLLVLISTSPGMRA